MIWFKGPSWSVPPHPTGLHFQLSALCSVPHLVTSLASHFFPPGPCLFVWPYYNSPWTSRALGCLSCPIVPRQSKDLPTGSTLPAVWAIITMQCNDLLSSRPDCGYPRSQAVALTFFVVSALSKDSYMSPEWMNDEWMNENTCLSQGKHHDYTLRASALLSDYVPGNLKTKEVIFRQSGKTKCVWQP